MKIFFLITFITLLFFFKINLIPIADTGFRIDDILIFMFAILLIFTKKMFLLKFHWFLILFIVEGLISGIINFNITGISLLHSILFSLRHFEYMLFFYIGYYLHFYKINIMKYFQYYIIYAMSLSTLMYFGYVQGFSKFNPDRFFANTNGPYEFAVIASILSFYFFYEKKYTYSILSFIGLLLSFSRITIVAHMIIFLLNVNKKLLIYFFIVISITLFLLPNDIALVQRYSELISIDTLNSFLSLIYEKSIIVTNQNEYFKYIYNDTNNQYISSLNGDSSALIRFYKWYILVTSVSNSYLGLLIGFGPSFASVGVDGNYIRIFVEQGIIGLLLYIVFLYYMYRYTKKYALYTLKASLLIIILSSIFIDIFVSYKVMGLIWFLYGYSFRNIKRNNQ